jgi:hypothetical protein
MTFFLKIRYLKFHKDDQSHRLAKTVELSIGATSLPDVTKITSIKKSGKNKNRTCCHDVTQSVGQM